MDCIMWKVGVTLKVLFPMLLRLIKHIKLFVTLALLTYFRLLIKNKGWNPLMPFENAANKTKHSYELPKGVAQQSVDLNKNSCFFLSITNLTLVFTFLRNVCFIILTPPLWSK